MKYSLSVRGHFCTCMLSLAKSVTSFFFAKLLRAIAERSCKANCIDKVNCIKRKKSELH